MPRDASELERALKALAAQDRANALRRPEKWVQWIGFVAIVVVSQSRNWGLLVLTVVAAVALGNFLQSRRLGARDRHELLALDLAERFPATALRKLRQGSFDAVIGPEARARLEDCARAFNTIFRAMGETIVFGAATLESRAASRELYRSAETVLRGALGLVARPTILRRPLDPSTVAALDEAAEALNALCAEMERLRDERPPAPAVPAHVLDHLADIRATEIAREAARIEIERGSEGSAPG